jgi:tetratricopeptide (TPR) repeat protein
LLQKTIEIDPKRAVAYLNLGDVYVKLNRIVEARQAYTKYLELVPDSKSAPDVKKQLNAPARTLIPCLATDGPLMAVAAGQTGLASNFSVPGNVFLYDVSVPAQCDNGGRGYSTPPLILDEGIQKYEPKPPQ